MSSQSTQNSGNHLNSDKIAALLFCLFVLGYGYQTSLIPLLPGDEYEPFNARTLPTILTYAGIGLSILLFMNSTAKSSEKESLKAYNWPLLLQFLVLMALYGYGLYLIGFLLATSLFLLGGFYLLGERRKSILFGASFPFVTAFYLLLTQGLDIYLEPGIVFFMW
jgi:putative tricarboxylic transport membrane protein